MNQTDFQWLMDHSADIICRVATDGTLLYVSPASVRVLGWKPDEMVGKPPYYFLLPEDIPIVVAAQAARERPADEGTKPHTVRMRRKDGTYAWMENSPHAVRDPVTGELRETVLVMRDVSERKALEERLAAQAMTDGLTGLANRRAFDERLEREWRRALREKSSLALLMLDIDHFKKFNDLNGHLAGDDCLREVGAAVLGSVHRMTDMVARYGGEELGVILPSTETRGATVVAERMRAAISDLRIPYDPGDPDGKTVTASMGVAVAVVWAGAEPMEMPKNLLLAADRALYQAKAKGRDRVVTDNLVIAPFSSPNGRQVVPDPERTLV